VQPESKWSRLERHYTTCNQETSEVLTRVEKLLQIVSSSSALQSPPLPDVTALTQKFRCLMMPQLKTSRFFDRVDVFEKLDQLLGPATTGSFRSVALYGLAGVGKSTIVSTYVERRYDEGIYDTVLWVRSEKPTLMRQSFSDIAMRLKLPGAQPQNHDENLLLVQEWFQTTG
jgi:hypothetical protein